MDTLQNDTAYFGGDSMITKKKFSKTFFQDLDSVPASSSQLQERVEREAEKFGDIVQVTML